MTQTYTPQRAQAERQLTEKQQRLLDLVVENGGDALKAARDAGYAQPYRAVKELSKEIIEIAENILAGHAVKAALKVNEVMDSEVALPQVDAKLKAAAMILDRTNPKTERMDISHEAKGGIFILPSKNE